jgi:hypothetical protein
LHMVESIVTQVGGLRALSPTAVNRVVNIPAIVKAAVRTEDFANILQVTRGRRGQIRAAPVGIGIVGKVNVDAISRSREVGDAGVAR